MEEGYAEGESIGMAKGKAEGKAEIAKSLLAEGFDVKLISKITDMSEEKIKKLHSELVAGFKK